MPKAHYGTGYPDSLGRSPSESYKNILHRRMKNRWVRAYARTCYMRDYYVVPNSVRAHAFFTYARPNTCVGLLRRPWSVRGFAPWEGGKPLTTAATQSYAMLCIAMLCSDKQMLSICLAISCYAANYLRNISSYAANLLPLLSKD